MRLRERRGATDQSGRIEVKSTSGTLDFNVPSSETELLQAWRGFRPEDYFEVYDDPTHPLVNVSGRLVGEGVDGTVRPDLTSWLTSQEE